MLSLLVSLLILVLILALFWWILSIIPVPEQAKWIVQLIYALICVILLLSVLTGAWQIPIFHTLR